MVGSRAAIVADDDELFHMKSLARLAGWGFAAAVSVVLVVYIGRTELGAKRFSMAIAAIGAPPGDPQQLATAQLSARVAGAEREARRAIETVQAISADRERLQSRIITMENETAELANSIRRGAPAPVEGRPLPEARSEPKPLQSLPTASTSSFMPARNPVPGWTATPVSSPQAAAAPEPAPKATVPERVVVAPTPAHPTETAVAAPTSLVPAIIPANPAPAASTNASLPRPTAAPAPTPAAPQAAAPPADAAATTAKAEDTTGSVASEVPGKVEFGVDLGPALTVARLRARWSKLVGERPDLVKGMRPLISVRDTGNGKPVEVRLLVGPITNVDGATAFCQALVSTQYLCRPSVFDGQRLAMQ
jgi:hypothetical protein